MIFRDVQLLNGGKYSDEKLKQNIMLMTYWENIRDLFCIHLPENFELLGIKKLKIQFGAFEGDAFLPTEADGIATFRRQDFAYDTFCQLPEKEKDERSLSYIEDSLIKICDRFEQGSMKKKIVRETANLVREGNFEHFRTHKKTSKWHQSKKLRAFTELHFKKGGIDATLIVANKSGDIITAQKIFESRFWESVTFDLWKGYWKEDKFRIETRVGETYFETEGFDEIAI